MNADGSGARRLSTDAGCAGQTEDAHWSPDGARIVYSCGWSYGENIYVMNADGSAPVAITPPGIFGSYYPSDIGPVWSPSGDRIAFSSPRGSFTYQAFVVPASGGNPAPVTSGSITTFVSDWGPPSR
jgi:TolB protein